MSARSVSGFGEVVGCEEEGLMSERMERGEMEVSIPWEECRCCGALGHEEVARDMSRTISGRTCLPSAWV